jgi:hypothetical protein
MHTRNLLIDGVNWNLHHNGDYSGDVIVRNLKTEQEMEIPFEVFKTLVADAVVSHRISMLEQGEPDDILGLR